MYTRHVLQKKSYPKCRRVWNAMSTPTHPPLVHVAINNSVSTNPPAFACVYYPPPRVVTDIKAKR